MMHGQTLAGLTITGRNKARLNWPRSFAGAGATASDKSGVFQCGINGSAGFGIASNHG